MEMKGITCKIPLELHNRISDEIRESESTMGKFIEMIIIEHYTKEENNMSKGRTLAFQVSEEFFQRIKDYLARYEEVYGRKLSQRQFVIELMAVPSHTHVYMETMEAAEDEETEPDKTGDTGILRPYGGKQPKRLLEDIQHNHGQKSTNKRKTDKQWLL